MSQTETLISMKNRAEIEEVAKFESELSCTELEMLKVFLSGFRLAQRLQQPDQEPKQTA